MKIVSPVSERVGHWFSNKRQKLGGNREATSLKRVEREEIKCPAKFEVTPGEFFD